MTITVTKCEMRAILNQAEAEQAGFGSYKEMVEARETAHREARRDSLRARTASLRALRAAWRARVQASKNGS